MPGPITAGEIAQVVIRSECAGQTILNVLHYRSKISLAPLTYFEALDQLMTKVGSPADPTIVKYMLPLMGSNARVKDIQAQRVSPTRNLYLRQTIDTPGTSVNLCDAQNVAAVLTKQVDLAGRGRTGSFHLGGLHKGAYVNGSLTVGAVTACNDLAAKVVAKILNDADATIWELVTFNQTGAGGPTYQLVTNVFPQTTLRVMRRRTVGLGI